jgi:hypothetical protein
MVSPAQSLRPLARAPVSHCPLYSGLTSSISSSSRKSTGFTLSTLLWSHQLNLFVLSQEHRFLSLAQTSPVYCLKYTGSLTIDIINDHEHHTQRRPVLLHSSNPLCNPLLGNSITLYPIVLQHTVRIHPTTDPSNDTLCSHCGDHRPLSKSTTLTLFCFNTSHLEPKGAFLHHQDLGSALPVSVADLWQSQNLRQFVAS